MADLRLVDQLGQGIGVYRRLAGLDRALQGGVLVRSDLALVAHLLILDQAPLIARQIDLRPGSDGVLADGFAIHRGDRRAVIPVVAGHEYAAHQGKSARDRQREGHSHPHGSTRVAAVGSAAGGPLGGSGAEGHRGCPGCGRGPGGARRLTEPYATAFRPGIGPGSTPRPVGAAFPGPKSASDSGPRPLPFQLSSRAGRPPCSGVVPPRADRPRTGGSSSAPRSARRCGSREPPSRPCRRPDAGSSRP